MYFKPDARITDDDYLKTYNVFKFGDIAFEGNKSKSFSHGRFVQNTIGDGIVSHVFVVFRPVEQEHDLDFWKYAINNECVMGRILARCTKKTTMMTNLVTNDFLSQTARCPSIQEQKKIANFLVLVEKRIALQSEYVDKLKKYKRGLSTMLFEEIEKSNCHSVVFADAFRLLQNNTFSRDDLSFDDGLVRNIHYGDVLIKYGTTVDVASMVIPYIKPDRTIEKYSAASYLRNGDVVFADTAEDYSVGKATEIMGVTDQRLLSGLHTIPCRPHDRFAPMYLGYYFNSAYFRAQIYRMVQGVKVSSISKSEIVKTTVLVPTYDEQEKIASILHHVDKRIEQEVKTCEVLRQIKHGLLQQLFI